MYESPTLLSTLDSVAVGSAPKLAFAFVIVCDFFPASAHHHAAVACVPLSSLIAEAILAKERAMRVENMNCKSREYAKWKTHSSTVRARFSIARSTEAWTPSHKLRGVPRSARVLDLLDVGFALRLGQSSEKLSTEELARGYFCDVSTSVGRLPFKQGTPGVFRQHSYCYSFEKDAVLTGMAQLELIGWPRSLLPRQFPDTTLRALSGESYSLPICTALNFVFYCNPWGPWWAGSS